MEVRLSATPKGNGFQATIELPDGISISSAESFPTEAEAIIAAAEKLLQMPERLVRATAMEADLSSAPAQCRQGVRHDRIDRLALGTAILMIHPVALIVASQKAAPAEIGNRTADIAAARLADTLANLFLHNASSLGRIGREFVGLFQCCAHRLDRRSPPGCALSYGNKRVAEPVTDGHGVTIHDDARAGTPFFVSDLREELQQHIGEFRAL